jgi:NADPH-dependent ferric siderophore reductase
MHDTDQAGPGAQDELLTAEQLEWINDEFAEPLRLVGRALGGRPEADATRVIGVDLVGVDTIVTADGAEHAARIDFEEPAEDAEQLMGAMLALVVRARELLGEEGTTSAEQSVAAMATIRTFLTEVVAVEDVNPHLRLVTFGGGDLTTFEPLGPDTFLYLLLPPPGRDELTIDQSFTWEAHATMPEADKPVGAYYTLRRWRPEVAELDVLMVLHGDSGPASAWALRAGPGDPVALWGPRTAYLPPPGTEHLVLVADETALPAVAVILEQLPDGVSAQVVAEVGAADERQELLELDRVTVSWHHRDGAEPGTTTALADAVRALPPFDTPTYVWGGGESRVMTAVRRHVRDERGLERDAVSLVAYWRRDATGDAEDNEDD